MAFFIAVKYIITSERNDLYEIATTQLVKMSRGWNSANSIPSRSLRDRLVIYIIPAYTTRFRRIIPLNPLQYAIPLLKSEVCCQTGDITTSNPKRSEDSRYCFTSTSTPRRFAQYKLCEESPEMLIHPTGWSFQSPFQYAPTRQSEK